MYFTLGTPANKEAELLPLNYKTKKYVRLYQKLREKIAIKTYKTEKRSLGDFLVKLKQMMLTLEVEEKAIG